MTATAESLMFERNLMDRVRATLDFVGVRERCEGCGVDVWHVENSRFAPRHDERTVDEEMQDHDCGGRDG